MTPPPSSAKRPTLAHLGILCISVLSVAAACTTTQPTKRTLARAATKPPSKNTLKTTPKTTPTQPKTVITPKPPAPSKAAPKEISYAEILRPDRAIPGTLSLGSPSTGTLPASKPLPLDGKHHKVIESCRERNTNHSTQEVIDLIEHASTEVAKTHKDSPALKVCNMSYDQGGDIRWSKSHNSGRDADIAFYVTFKGKPVEAPRLLHISSKLRSSDGYVFDTPRNWTFVKSVLTHPTIQTQWLFISRPLKNALLEHARSQGEDEALIQKASKVLHQPTDSSPHNDHFHLRVYCARKDRLEGCLHFGPVWPWVDDHGEAVKTRADELLKALQDPAQATREASIEFMIKIRATQAALPLAQRALLDPSPVVRLKALSALARFGDNSDEVIDTIIETIRRPGGGILAPDPSFEEAAPFPEEVLQAVAEPLPSPTHDVARTRAVLEASYRTLSSLAASSSIPFLQQALRSKRVLGNAQSSIPESAVAAIAAQHVMDLRLVDSLIDALDTPHVEARVEVSKVLQRITNHSFSKVSWGSEKLSTKKRKRFVKKWRAWWKKHRSKSRDELLLEGFRTGRRSMRKTKRFKDVRTVERLIALTKRDSYLGYNANRVLSSVTGRWSPVHGRDPEWIHARWKKWFRKNKKRLKKAWKR